MTCERGDSIDPTGLRTSKPARGGADEIRLPAICFLSNS